MSEDVVVLGHTHTFRNTKFVGKCDNHYYVNSGTWIDLADHVSFVQIYLMVGCKIIGSKDLQRPVLMDLIGAEKEMNLCLEIYYCFKRIIIIVGVAGCR